MAALSRFSGETGRAKLCSDQDVTTAAALLKSADVSLADMNDPQPDQCSSRDPRWKISPACLRFSQVDYDGIILKLNQLPLRLITFIWPIITTMIPDRFPTVKSCPFPLSESRINLQKAGRTLMDNFITIRRRDKTAVPLLAPNQYVICARTLPLACWWQHRRTASPGRDLQTGAG
ncbi:uroporphyrinogen-III C-methyltransferase [Shigella flexneri]